MAETTLTATQVKFWVKDALIVGDPCYYDTDDGSSSEEIEVLNRDDIVILKNAKGYWTAKYELLNAGQWGIRVSKLILTRCHPSFNEVAEEYIERGENIPIHMISDALSNDGKPVGLKRGFSKYAVVGVDSGQMGAFCLSETPIDYSKLMDYYDTRFNGHNAHMIDFGEGAISSTGFGDGGYELTVQNGVDDRPAKVVVEFINPEDEEENEE